jgi:radical SAM protein with 4Fe4S-binding SPASM domain
MLIKENKIPKGINALILLNYKNIGQGDVSNVITGNEPNLKELFSLLDSKLDYRIGLDSCSCQFVGKFMKNVASQSVASCDSGVFSAYISPSGIFTPCSFDQAQAYGIDLNTHTVEEAWNSLQFEIFRDKQRNGLESGKCKSCEHHIDVCKPCVLVPDINICAR